jgi:hypothetical protein
MRIMSPRLAIRPTFAMATSTCARRHVCLNANRFDDAAFPIQIYPIIGVESGPLEFVRRRALQTVHIA